MTVSVLAVGCSKGSPSTKPRSLSDDLSQVKGRLEAESKALDEKLRSGIPAYHDTLLNHADAAFKDEAGDTLTRPGRAALEEEIKGIARFAIALKKVENDCKSTSALLLSWRRRIIAAEGSSAALEEEAKDIMANALAVAHEATTLVHTQVTKDGLPGCGAIEDAQIAAVIVELLRFAKVM